MAEQIGTPGSNADMSVNGQNKAPKDKACPFCAQQFTSSSLGRHLDLYIKEKNPKAPDGIHDVIEIRKLREGITRRQPRTSGARTSRREDSTPAGTPGAHDRRSPRPESGNESPSLRREDGMGDGIHYKRRSGYSFNKGSWESTGVMNHIPPPRDSMARGWDGEDRDPSRRLEPRSRSVSKQMLAKTTFEQKQKMIDALDNAKAAELALRELLGSIRAARQRIDGPDIFDYDPLKLDFPSLALHCLPPPPTLYQSTTIPTTNSWSTHPPGETQYHALVDHFSAAFHNWRVSVATATTTPPDDLSYPPNPQSSMFGLEDPAEVAQRAEAAATELENKISRHLHISFGHWTALPMPKRSEIWTLELARGIGRKSEETDKLKKERDFHKQETAHLRQQVDELSRLQHPREFKLSPPSTIAFGAPLLSMMADEGMQANSTGFTLLDGNMPLDAVIERAIGRWKGVVREARGSAANGGGLAAQRSLSGGSSHSATSSVPPQLPQLQQPQQHQNPNGKAHENVNENGVQAQAQAQSMVPVITSPVMTPMGASGGDGSEADADADADADMEDDDSYVEQMSEMGRSRMNGSESTSLRLSNGNPRDGGGGDGGGSGGQQQQQQQRSDLDISTRMEGLEGQVVPGYMRIGA
ncbi:hypothetical protein LZ554_007631 [Drepanopeziza brunnea f. sp. 'monogermtubi']|nr:hypothetical protein LZ554_007631 [Drepanopeziza brunnea f. sp. 'monogermtubi']